MEGVGDSVICENAEVMCFHNVAEMLYGRSCVGFADFDQYAVHLVILQLFYVLLKEVF
jgi:hypothetical protein